LHGAGNHFCTATGAFRGSPGELRPAPIARGYCAARAAGTCPRRRSGSSPRGGRLALTARVGKTPECAFTASCALHDLTGNMPRSRSARRSSAAWAWRCLLQARRIGSSSTGAIVDLMGNLAGGRAATLGGGGRALLERAPLLRPVCARQRASQPSLSIRGTDVARAPRAPPDRTFRPGRHAERGSPQMEALPTRASSVAVSTP
jgi:hypothetical protein